VTTTSRNIGHQPIQDSENDKRMLIIVIMKESLDGKKRRRGRIMVEV